MPSAPLIGLDIGGTNIKLVVLDATSLRVLSSEMIPTEAQSGLDHVLERAASLVKKIVKPGATHIGVGIAGLVRQPEGVLYRAPNITHSTDAKVKQILTKHLGVTVAVANDAQCFSLAEAVLGAGKDHRVVCGITVGTGVGGGLIVEKNIFFGANGFAGEVGHMLLKPGQPPKGADDERGDAEQFFSGTALHKRCDKAENPDDLLHGTACAFLHPDIFCEIAWLCTSLTYAYDPSIIIFGGTTGKALKPHLPSIAKELKKWLLPATPVPMLAASTMEHAGAIGAALLTR